MRNLRKDAKSGVLVLVAAVMVSQVIRIDKTNPPLHSGAMVDPAVKPLLKKACYDCHSNETVWPWYSNVAPVSWLLGSDVNDGRKELNFSEWNAYAGQTRDSKLKAIAKEVDEKEMPPWYYAIMHRDSHLSPEERNAIKDWANAELRRTSGSQ